jgi:NAD(P)-dependent dehydrogenase (short-subunit alcohol dehydrogenase family)
MSKIVITGAGRGIGMAAALMLARSGHSVIATMRDSAGSPELEGTAMSERLPIQIERMDVDSDESVSDCFSRIQASSTVDVLVNNAGVERLGSVEETSLGNFRACMETNYFGAIRCIQAVIPRMRVRRHGTIINVSSVAGRISAAPMTPYTASKFALEALSEALAQEVKPFGIRVAIVQPGITDTRMARNVGRMPASGIYHQAKHIAAMFAASLAAGAATPDMVARKIREIIESGTWQLRHAATPDAGPFLAWRASMTDEQWVEWGALDDVSWKGVVNRDFGLDVKL